MAKPLSVPNILRTAVTLNNEIFALNVLRWSFDVKPETNIVKRGCTGYKITLYPKTETLKVRPVTRKMAYVATW